MRSPSTPAEPPPSRFPRGSGRTAWAARTTVALLLISIGLILATPTPAPAASRPLPGREAAAPKSFPGRTTSQAAPQPLPHPSSLTPPALLPAPSSLLPRTVDTALREDLAARIGVPLSRVTVVSFDDVTWADACLGVHEPGIVCAQLLTHGFLATLAVEALPWLFPYHGAGAAFIPAPFIQDATLTLPLEIQ